MEAMRDLLANIRPMDPPLENQGGNADEERDEEEWDWRKVVDLMRKLSRSGGSDGFQKVVDPTKKLSKSGGF